MDMTTDLLERELVASELTITDLRIRQAVLIAEADRRQLPTADGCRSLQAWVASRMDVAPETAAALTKVALTHKSADSEVRGVSFDRLVELCRLSSVLSSDEGALSLHDSLAFDIQGLRRHVASCRKMTPQSVRQVSEGRFLAMQPNLDGSLFRLWGQLGGVQGRILEAVLDRRADSFPKDIPSTLGQRRADALVSIAQDSHGGGSSAPLVSVFIEAERFSGGGETGVSVETGPRVGPNTLQTLICTGQVEVVGLLDGRPLGVGRRTRIVPPRLRRYVLHRDRACVIDACTSRYRLQPHHVVPWSDGGTTEADNLATLCWYHHHIVIHTMGYRLNPNTPTQRKRFLPP